MSESEASTPNEKPVSRVGFESGRHMRGSLLMAIGRGIGLVAGMLIQLIIVRMLSPADYGDLAWGLAMASIATAFVALGMDSMVSRFFTTYEEERDDAHLLGVLIFTTAVPVLLGTLVAGLALVLNSWIWPGIAPSEQAAAILPLILLIAPLAAVDMILAELFASFGEAGTVFFRRYILDPALRLGAIGLVFVLAGGVTQVAIALVAAAGVGVLIYGQLTWRLVAKYHLWEGAGGRIRFPVRPLAAAIPAAMTIALIWAISNPLPTAVLGSAGDAVEIAYLRASLIIANLPITIRAAISVMFLAGATRLWRSGQRTELARTYWTTGLWVGTITLPILVLLVGFPEQTATTLFGDDYANAATLMVVTGGGLWLVASLGPSTNLLLVTRNDRWTFVLNLRDLGRDTDRDLCPHPGLWGNGCRDCHGRLTAAVNVGSIPCDPRSRGAG